MDGWGPINGIDYRIRLIDRGDWWLVELVDFDGELQCKLSADTTKE